MTASPLPGADEAREAHRAFLDRYYGVSRGFYDLTRRYYLLGREPALATLAQERWSHLIEVGPGTGRNLRKLHAKRPEEHYGGVEPCRPMLDVARRQCPWAAFEEGFAEDTDLSRVLDRRPDRILFSYSLSMVQEPLRALQNARRALAPGGQVVVVDFGKLETWPQPWRRWMQQFLATFHVNALPEHLERDAQQVRHGGGGYWVLYRFGPLG